MDSILKEDKQKSIKSPGGQNLSLPIWLLLICQRLVVNFGDEQISISLILLFLFIIVWSLTGKLNILWKRLSYYLIVAGLIIFSSLISLNNSSYFSIKSLLLLIVLYFPSILIFNNVKHLVVLTQFHKAMIFFSVIGIIQFIFQLLNIYLHDLWNYVPEEIVITSFNFVIPLEFGSIMNKSNGLVFLEPSFFSQFIALAIIIELNLLKKNWRLILFIPALLFTFSGTGLLLLALGSFHLIPRGRWKQIFLLCIFALILGSIFFSSGYGQYIARRLTEFQRPGSSAYQRFISPFINYWDFINNADLVNILLGLGPGSSNRYFWTTLLEPNIFVKVFVEYGIVGFIFLLYLMLIFFEKKPFWLSFSIFFTLAFLSGGSILVPQIIVIFYIILLFHHNIVQETPKSRLSKL